MEFNITLLLSNFLAEQAKTFEAHHNVFDGSKPYSISNLVTLLSPANAILSDALDDKTEQPELDTIASKLKYVIVE